MKTLSDSIYMHVNLLLFYFYLALEKEEGKQWAILSSRLYCILPQKLTSSDVLFNQSIFNTDNALVLRV